VVDILACKAVSERVTGYDDRVLSPASAPATPPPISATEASTALASVNPAELLYTPGPPERTLTCAQPALDMIARAVDPVEAYQQLLVTQKGLTWTDRISTY
jgi:hypothetical protein